MAGFVEKLAAAMGYQRYGNTTYGRTNGIFFNVAALDAASGQNAPTVRAYVRREGGVDLAAINAFLNQKWEGLQVRGAGADETSVWMNIGATWSVKADNVAVLLNAFSAYLAANGYYSACSLCGTAQGLGHTERDGRVMEVCGPCHGALAGAAEEAKAERVSTGSYAKGALGAVLGGIVGIIPWVLIGLLGFIAAVSGLIMAWLSHKGYTLLGGKRGRGMVWILIAVLIVFTYFGVMTSTYVAAVQEVRSQGYELVDNAFLKVMAMPFEGGSDAGALWGQLALGWFFAALGSFGLIRRANREASGKDLAVRRIGTP